MYKKIIKHIKIALIFTTLSLVLVSTLFISCNKEATGDSGIVSLNSFGPMPIARGAELRFIGLNLDKVISISLPGGIEILAASFVTKTPTLVTITVPQNAVEGLVVVKTPEGNITTKTPIGFSEPITIAGLAPSTIKADSVLTITGDYLNLVKEVIFTDRVSVVSTDFISQSRSQLKVKVPATAQTGKISVSNSKADPIIVYSTTTLNVKLPVIATFLPNPVKAGANLTITGADLDLVKIVSLGGNQNVNLFVSKTATQLVFKVPDVTQDDTLKLIPASGIKVKTLTKLVMVVPTVSVTPTIVKNGGDITVTGTNLDLVDKVVFGGAKEGIIKAGATATQIVVTIPNDAVTGIVKFTTKAAKEVAGPSLTIVDPVLTSFLPASVKAKNDVTINGTNLDLVVDVVFVGGVKGTIAAGSTDKQLIVNVPVGAKDGKITLVAKNGVQIQSANNLLLLANLPNITSFTEARGEPGKKLTLNGTNMLLIKELVFPGDVKATAYGLKTDTKVEVYVPISVTRGYGNIKLFTYEGEEGLSPQIYLGATEPVVNPLLIINDFDEVGHDLGWDNWGGNVELGSDPALGISGKYMHGTKTNCAGWAWIWGCNHGALVKRSVTKADHLLKMDINITKAYGECNFQIKMGGNDINLGPLGISNGAGKYSTPGWITITFDLSTFASLPATIPGSGDWGMILSSGTIDITGLYIDNIRFQRK